MSQSVIADAAGLIQGSTDITPDMLTELETTLEGMDLGALLGLWLQSSVIGLTMQIMGIIIFVLVYGRMIEIYLMTSLAPLPVATLSNRELGGTGQNYLKSLFAVGFQGMLILVCVAIYAVLIQGIATGGDPIGAIWGTVDEGKTWESYSHIEETEYFTYDEFSAWLETETENIQKLVDAGEWTEAEATEALEYYDEILKSILEGKMVGKRASSSDDQLFFSMPDNAQPEQYQTFVFDGNTYKSIGPFDTEEELFNALKEYTDTEVEAGTMTQTEATALLEKYQ